MEGTSSTVVVAMTVEAIASSTMQLCFRIEVELLLWYRFFCCNCALIGVGGWWLGSSEALQLVAQYHLRN
jgi:hypothetical protein